MDTLPITLAAAAAQSNFQHRCPCNWFIGLIRDGMESRRKMRRKQFSVRLGILLKERDWTHERFAELIGLSTSMISHYKTSRSLPPPEGLEDIADFFDVSIDWLLGRTDIRQVIKTKNPPTVEPPDPGESDNNHR